MCVIKSIGYLGINVLYIHIVLQKVSKHTIQQVINFLLNFDLTKTILLGWDPVNDKRMLDALLNYGDHLINLDSFQWFDLATPYRQLYKPGKKDTPSLKEACESLKLGAYDFHDAEVDVLATSALLEALLEKHGTKSILLDYLLPKKRIKYIKKRVKEEK